MSRLLRVALLPLLPVLLLLGPGAQAHDELIASDPRDGATLDDAPDEIVLTFSGDISELGAQVALEDGSGRSLTEGEPRVEGAEVEQDLADLPAGAYTVLWRVTSEDGHPISGALTFTVVADIQDGDDGDDGDPSSSDEAPSDEAATASTPTVAPPPDEPTSSPAAAEVDADADAQGLPLWAWVVMAGAAVGLAALLARTWSRGRV